MQFGRYLVLAYLLLEPLIGMAVSSVNDHDQARIAELLLMLLCAACLLLGRPLDLPASRTGRWVLAAMLVLAVVSISMADRPGWAVREACLLLGLVAVAWATASVPDLRALRHDAVVVVAAASFYAAIALCITALSLANGQALYGRELVFGYNHPRFFNHVQTVVLPLLALAASWRDRPAWFNRSAWFALVVGCALLWLTGGRATLVAVVAAGIVGWVWLGNKARPVVLRLAIGLAAGLVLYLLLYVALPGLLGIAHRFELGARAQDANSVHTRLFLWQTVADHVRTSPLWGIGPMHFSHHQNFDAAHPHNIYLQIAAEWGLPMLGLVLVSGGWALRRLGSAVRACAQADQALLGAGLLVAVVAVLCDGLFSGNFVMPVSQVWIAALAGWCIAWVRWQSPDGDVAPPLRSAVASRAACGLLLASQIWLVADVAPEMKRLPQFLGRTMQQFPSSHLNPRFWSHGWF